MRQLKDLAISDSGFLFDPYTGLTFSVNPSGKFLLEELRAGRDPSRLAPALRWALACWTTEGCFASRLRKA